ncbi:MAG TPA: phosphotransferase [Gaiellaceae bacterium]|jgi:aminoglycoside phosphotransferase
MIPAPARAQPEAGWLPGFLPASARRLQVADDLLRETLAAAGAELVDSAADVEIGPAAAIEGVAPLALVPVWARSRDVDGRVPGAADRILVSLRARLRATHGAAQLRRRGYRAEVVGWDLNRRLFARPRSLEERLPRRALAIGRRGATGPTLLDALLAEAEVDAAEIVVREAFLVAAGPGRVVRVAIGPAAELLRVQRESLAGLRPLERFERVVPRVVADGRTGLADWLAERRLQGNPAAEAPPDALDFLVALFGGGEGAPVRAADDAELLAALVPAEADGLRGIAASVDDALAGVRRGFVHGDFWSGNLLVEDDRLSGVVDWDAAGPGRLPLVDLLHLRLIEARRPAGHRWGPALIDELLPWARRGGDEAAARYASAVGLDLDADRLRALVAGYWLQRLAYQAGSYADRVERPRWLENNLTLPLRAFAQLS